MTKKFYDDLLKYTKSLSTEDTSVITTKRLMELDKIEQYFDTNWSKLKQIPPPPKPPLNRIIRDDVWQTCDNCGSSMAKNGFLGLFGTRYCINIECPLCEDNIVVFDAYWKASMLKLQYENKLKKFNQTFL
jgi:hypothetical protein